MTSWKKDSLAFLQKQPIIIWLFFVAIVSFLYHGTNDIVLNDDAFQFFSEYKKEGWGGFYQNYGFSSLYYVTHLLNIVFYHLFGINDVWWLSLLILLHATNAFLAHRLFYAYYSQQNIAHAFLTSFAGASLFLVSPAQSENITWVATLHYGLSMFCFLFIGLIVLHTKKELSIGKIALLLGVYALSLLIMEYALIFPFCWWVLSRYSLQPHLTINKKLWIGFLLLIPLYFIATKMIKGHFIPHYSTEHLENHSPLRYLTNYTNYTSKHLLFSHFYPTAGAFYKTLNEWYALLFIWTVAIWLSYRYYNSNKHRAIVFLKLCLLSFFLLMPVINMYFNVIHQYENNRLGYYFSLALFQIICFILFESFQFLAYLIYMLLLCLNIFFTFKTTADAKIAGRIFKHCLQTFPDSMKKNVYLLNMPNNYKGFYLFRDTWRLQSALHFFCNKNISLIQVASTNLLHYTDSFYCVGIADSVYKVGHNNPGDYFMRGPYGAYDREDSSYSFDVDEWLMNYEVRLKKPLGTDDRLLLFNKDRFEVVH